MARVWHRPAMAMQRTEKIDIRLTAEELAEIDAAAERDERTRGDWARLTLLRAARAMKEKVE